MLSGIVNRQIGPLLKGHLHFLAPVETTIEVNFLVDTGSAETIVSLRDIRELGPERIRTLSQNLSADLRTLVGVGGTAYLPVTRVVVILVHDIREESSTFVLNAPILMNTTMPSILGRDILMLGDVYMNKDIMVQFDVAQGIHDLRPRTTT